MLDKLIDFLLNIINDLNPLFFVREYQQAILFRLGRFHKVLEKGPHFKIPFIDEYTAQHTVWTTLTLPAQSLMTKDNKNIVVKGMIKYKVSDIKIFILEVYDSTDALSDITQGIIKNLIMSKSYEECLHPEIDSAITKKARVELKKSGVEISQVTLTDISLCRAIRLINEQITNT